MKANTVAAGLVTANYWAKTDPEKAAAILGLLVASYGMEGAKMLGYEDVADLFSDFHRKITKRLTGEEPGEKPKKEVEGEPGEKPKEKFKEYTLKVFRGKTKDGKNNSKGGWIT